MSFSLGLRGFGFAHVISTIMWSVFTETDNRMVIAA
jgi:hypothetical protein